MHSAKHCVPLPFGRETVKMLSGAPDADPDPAGYTANLVDPM